MIKTDEGSGTESIVGMEVYKKSIRLDPLYM